MTSPNTSSDLGWPTYRLKDDAFSIQHMHRIGYTAMKGFHLHDSFEIYYLTKGERVYFIKDRVYTATPGDIVIINPHVLHRTTSSSDVQEFERILLNFKAEFVQSPGWPEEDLLPFVQGSCLIRLSDQEQPEINRMFREMLTECEQRKYGYAAYVKSLLTKLLVRIRRQGLQEEDKPHQYAHPMHEKISEIAAYLNLNYPEKITLEQVSRQFFISPSYLSRIFKKLTGFHFREYLLVVRVKEAQKLLRESQEKVITIAQAVGFEHVSNFNTTFKKFISVSPLKYRKLYQDNGSNSSQNRSTPGRKSS